VLLATGDRFCSTAAARRCDCTVLDRGDGGGRAGRRPSGVPGDAGGSDDVVADVRFFDARTLSSLLFFSERSTLRPLVRPSWAAATGVARFICVVDGEDSAISELLVGAGCQDLYRDSLSELAQPVARLFPYDGRDVAAVHGPTPPLPPTSPARRSAVSTM